MNITITQLPEVPLIRIGSFLQVSDLIALRCVCRIFRTIYSDDASFWKKMVDPNHPWNKELRKRDFCQICAEKWAETRKEEESWCEAIVRFYLNSEHDLYRTVTSLRSSLPSCSIFAPDCYYIPCDGTFSRSRRPDSHQHHNPVSFLNAHDCMSVGLQRVLDMYRHKIFSWSKKFSKIEPLDSLDRKSRVSLGSLILDVKGSQMTLNDLDDKVSQCNMDIINYSEGIITVKKHEIYDFSLSLKLVVTEIEALREKFENYNQKFEIKVPPDVLDYYI